MLTSVARLRPCEFIISAIVSLQFDWILLRYAVEYNKQTCTKMNSGSLVELLNIARSDNRARSVDPVQKLPL